MFTASSSRALSARAAVVERLRRVLFSPQRLLTAGTLACVLACGGYAVGQDIFTHDTATIGAGLEFRQIDNTYYLRYGAAYANNQIQWQNNTSISVDAAYYKMETTDDGNIKLASTVDDPSNKQKYELFYCRVDEQGNPIPATKIEELCTEADYFDLRDDDRLLFKPFYVTYETQDYNRQVGTTSDGQPITEVHNLRTLYTNPGIGYCPADFRLYRDSNGAVIDTNRTTVFVEYHKEITGSLVKDGSGTAWIYTSIATDDNGNYIKEKEKDGYKHLDTAHNIDNLTVNGGTLYLCGITNLSGSIEINARTNEYDHNPTLVVQGIATIDGTFKNNGGQVNFQDVVTINGTYISQTLNNRHLDFKATSYARDVFNETVEVSSTGSLIARNAFFSKSLELKNGANAHLYEDTKFTKGTSINYNNPETKDYITSIIRNDNKVVVEAGATLHSTDNALEAVGAVQIDGILHLGNFNKTREGIEQVLVDVNPNGEVKYYVNPNAVDTQLLVETYDENGDPTSLTVNNCYQQMTDILNDSKALGSWKDSINSTAFTGSGTIDICALALAQQGVEGSPIQTTFFTVFNGDKSEFNGKTDVTYGTLTLLSSSYNDIQKSEKLVQDWNDAKSAYMEAYNTGDPSTDEKYNNFIKALNARDDSLQKQVYGNVNSGVFTVYGNNKGIIDKSSIYSTGTNGRLAFWRDTFNGDLEYSDVEGSAYQESLKTAPILNAKTIDFQGHYNANNEYLHTKGSNLGAQIVFNTTFKYNDAKGEEKTDITSARRLAELNANTIAFSESNYVWYDGISQLDESAKLTIDLNADTIKVYTNDATSQYSGATLELGKDADGNILDANGNYYLVDANNANTDALKGVFAKPLVNANITGQAGDYAVEVNAINVARFAENEGMTQAEQDYAKKLDVARKDKDANVRFNDALYNENDGNKVKQTIHNLSLLGHQMLNQHSHVGNPTSAFFGGASLSASTKRGQDERNDEPLADLPQDSAINNNEKEQEEYNPTRGLWASFTHTNVDGATYQDRGVTMHGYDLRRSGIIGGMKRQYDATLSGGLFFGLTLPEIESNAAEKSSGASVYSKMEMTDFQFAGHLEKVFADNWELCLFVGGGHQSMDWERTVNQKYKYTADSTGNTLTGTAYLAYRIDMNDRWTIRPTVGIDSEHSWLYNFTETGGELGSLAELGYANQMLAQRYRYEDTYYNRNLARVGFTTAFDGAQGWAGLNGRVFYSTQLGGKPSALLTYRTVGDVNDANYLDLNFEDMGSHVMGSDAFSVGGGGYMHLNKTKTLTANGDINAIWYKNASTLNVTGGVSYRF